MGKLWPYLERLAALLDPDERQSVLGDIEERGANLRALVDLVALVAVRQFQAWKSWRTWLLAICLALPVLAAVGGAQVVADTTSYYPWPGLTEPRLQYFLATVLCRLAAAVGLAWAIGFSLAALAGYRSVGLLLTLTLVSFWQVTGPVTWLLAGTPVLLGLARGRHSASLRPRSAAWLAILCIPFVFAVPNADSWMDRCLGVAAFWPVYFAIAMPTLRGARV
jgi:hypothetical protein